MPIFAKNTFVCKTPILSIFFEKRQFLQKRYFKVFFAKNADFYKTAFSKYFSQKCRFL
jgi:hypothetical protein